jgi:hypothetical protein
MARAREQDLKRIIEQVLRQVEAGKAPFPVQIELMRSVL